MTVTLVTIALVLDALLSWGVARMSHRWLPVQASAAAPYVDDLFALETGIGAFIFLGCTAVMAWSLLFHRAPRYDMADGAPIEGNPKLEIAWTILPLVVVLLISAHAIRVNTTLATLGGKERVLGADTALRAAGRPAGAAATAEGEASYGPIEVIGRQWSWEFVYPNGVRSTELHLPVDRRVRFRLVSMDVLHGFYIPAFRLKQDLVPGSVIDYSLVPTRPGRYRLRDSMFSGGYFSSNQTDVVVEDPERFQAWLTASAVQPLRRAVNPADTLWRERRARGDRGWATVPPAPPPMVNVDNDPSLPHEA
ncbi:MAG: cytochrome c oxidase subunit II [Synechococcaceae cyanobacterium]|nr:cytochrome c oxidase subunit II [Synechococcaceae cyanobacterium]